MSVKHNPNQASKMALKPPQFIGYPPMGGDPNMMGYGVNPHGGSWMMGGMNQAYAAVCAYIS